MDRRESLKSLVAGAVLGGVVVSGCEPKPANSATPSLHDHFPNARTAEELARDQELLNMPSPYTPEEEKLLSVLADLILPADDLGVEASETNIVDFIAFMGKDKPQQVVPMKGGLAWINHEASKRFERGFSELSQDEQKMILDDIAYPEQAKDQFAQGVKFFSNLRNMVCTGYFTSQAGIKALDYQGNVANIWDGPPIEVLNEHGFEYEDKYISQYVKAEDRNKIAQWDADGNLIA